MLLDLLLCSIKCEYITSSIDVVLIIKLVVVVRFEIDDSLGIKIDDLEKIVSVKEGSRLLIY